LVLALLSLGLVHHFLDGTSSAVQETGAVPSVSTSLQGGGVQPASVKTLGSGQALFPPYSNDRDRFGFDAGANLSLFDVSLLKAGWYSNWWYGLNPRHPDRLTYVQMIRLHAGTDPHDPAQVAITPDLATIAQIARTHPGSLWLLGNEPDSLYQGEPIYPEVYAVVYHDLYRYIKDVDPTAIIANGGIVQPTPCRMAYLDIVWETYQQTYGEPMPVDLWNIHAFILREVYGSWGASTPPGVDPSCGIDYKIREGDDINIFRANLIAFRQWMKDKGQQNKPLIISEYGILWPDWLKDENGQGWPPERVSRFMTQTFDLFLNEAYPDVGYPADGYRLVQAWAWYSLSDDRQYNGYLFHSDSHEISPMGQVYATYTAALSDTPQADLTVRLSALQEGALRRWAAQHPSSTLTMTLALTGEVANLGKLTVTNTSLLFAPIRYETTGTVALPFSTTPVTVPPRYDSVLAWPLSLTLQPRHRYDLVFQADPADQVDEPREWNNTVTATLDLRADLWPRQVDYVLGAPASGPGPLTTTLVLTNGGSWWAQPNTLSLALRSETGMLLTRWPVSQPWLAPAQAVTLTTVVSRPAPGGDFYLLSANVDAYDVVPEQDEGNNAITIPIPVVLTATLFPTQTVILTSAGGDLAFLFPAGLVTQTSVVTYTPYWLSDLSATPFHAAIAFSLTLDRPLTTGPVISLTWRYRDEDLAGYPEGRLALYRRVGGGWQPAACTLYQRQPEANRLTVGLCQTGFFVLGPGYTTLLPVVTREGAGSTALGALPEESTREAAPGQRIGPLLLPDR